MSAPRYAAVEQAVLAAPPDTVVVLLLPEDGDRLHAVMVVRDVDDDGVDYVLIVDAQRNQVGRRPADGRPVLFVPVGAAGLAVEGAVPARAVAPNVAGRPVAGGGAGGGGGVGGGGLWAGGVLTGADLGDSGYVALAWLVQDVRGPVSGGELALAVAAGMGGMAFEDQAVRVEQVFTAAFGASRVRVGSQLPASVAAGTRIWAWSADGVWGRRGAWAAVVRADGGYDVWSSGGFEQLSRDALPKVTGCVIGLPAPVGSVAVPTLAAGGGGGGGQVVVGGAVGGSLVPLGWFGDGGGVLGVGLLVLPGGGGLVVSGRGEVRWRVPVLGAGVGVGGPGTGLWPLVAALVAAPGLVAGLTGLSDTSRDWLGKVGAALARPGGWRSVYDRGEMRKVAGEVAYVLADWVGVAGIGRNVVRSFRVEQGLGSDVPDGVVREGLADRLRGLSESMVGVDFGFWIVRLLAEVLSADRASTAGGLPPVGVLGLSESDMEGTLYGVAGGG